MKKLALYIFAMLLSGNMLAQTISPADTKQLKEKEDSLKTLGMTIVQGRSSEERMDADSQFTRTFVRALQIKNSFYYPFDSLVTISKLSPEDNTFKIFTWQLMISDNMVRNHGAIQMRTKDGSLKIFPLIDKSSIIQKPQDTITGNSAWIGALYYKLIEKKSFGKSYYTLLGFDENDIKSTKKIIEILTFKDGIPVFGGGFFSFPGNASLRDGVARYIMEFKKDASPRLIYDPEMDMIVFEHLISETGEQEKKYTYIPDGDYEALKWRDGKWVYIEKLFPNTPTPTGQPPMPHPLRDEKGNIDQSKLGQKVKDN
ncbi:MAG: hypothetical protein ABI266_00300 [Ginsengibacter sp.]